MNPAPRRKLPTPRAGVAPFLPARPGDARSVTAATASPTRLPTALALHAAMLLSGVAIGCGGNAEGGEAIHADRREHVAAVSSTTTLASSSATTLSPGTMASTFLDPDPHDVDGQAAIITPPPVPTTAHTIVTTKPTTGPKTGGVKPPVRPLPSATAMPLAGRMIGPRPSPSTLGAMPCPPRDPGAST